MSTPLWPEAAGPGAVVSGSAADDLDLAAGPGPTDPVAGDPGPTDPVAGDPGPTDPVADGPAPGVDWRPTGHAAVDAAVRSVLAVGAEPPAAQVAAYQAAHRALRETLASIDQEA